MEKENRKMQEEDRAEDKRRGYLQEDFRLFHLKDAKGTKMEAHYHEFCKLVFLISGTGGYTVEGSRYSLAAGDILLIGSRQIHQPEFERGISYERFIFYIAPEFLERHSTGECHLEEIFRGKGGHVLKTRETDRRVFLKLAEQLEKELAEPENYAKDIMANSLLLQFLAEAGRRKKKSTTIPEVPPVADARIQKMLEYIKIHLAEELDVDNLSERFYLSRYHLMHLFKKETGQTINDYLTGQRLNLARELMQQGISATESCFRAGFGSYSSFTRAYGKRFGTTPTGRNGRCIPMDEMYEL